MPSDTTRPTSGSNADRPALTAPALPGLLGPSIAATRPAQAPSQAGASLQGQALPTNQWWTSALTGSGTSTLWAFPIAVRADGRGLGLGAATPAASADAVVTSPEPALRVGGPVDGVSVEDYGDFSVQLALKRSNNPTLRATVAQGLPYVAVSADAGPLPIALGAGSSVQLGRSTGGEGADVPMGSAVRTSRVRVRTMGQEWDLATDSALDWRRGTDDVTVTAPGPFRLLLSPVPEGADADWGSRVESWTHDPVSGTSSTLTRIPGAARQELQWQAGSSSRRVVALLPHQRAALARGAGPAYAAVPGRYRTARGDLTLVELPPSAPLVLDVGLAGFLPGVPEIGLDPASRQAVLADVDRDLQQPVLTGGSYYGPKELGRLATLAEITSRLGDAGRTAALLGRLRPLLEDWLSYTGPQDERWLSYDATWGGIVANPPEFGNQDYNDHHFHYGYLLHAAAVVAAADPAFGDRFAPVVDSLVADLVGGRADRAGATAFPPFRVWNAYQGHSNASGYGDTPDGSNQESSSEAVHAWEGVARWGLARADPETADAGLTRYAVEALSARTYWLGEGERLWPADYRHDTAGIVWGGKTDFATFFDGRPEAVLGIQLLPYTFASLYRADPAAALRRRSAIDAVSGGTPRLWPDLFLMDLGLADPKRALGLLRDDLPIEPGNSRALTRYWLLALDRLGPPRTDVVADQPYGLAFGRTTPVFAAVAPTAAPVQVAWRDPAGQVVADVSVPGGGAVTRP